MTLLNIDVVDIPAECPVCKTKSLIRVAKTDYERYKGGTLIQNAFPYLTPDEREAIMTGICPECWNKMFPVDDE